MKSYTRKQRAILEFIANRQKADGISPSLEEIGREFGVSRVTVFQHVAALERRGALRRGVQQARSIEILDPDFLPKAPFLVRGTIAAGRPLEAVEEPEPIDTEDILPTDGEHYALRVRGDSMVDDAICDGDLVIVRRGTSARNGQVVVAVVGEGDATLKRYYKLPDGRVRLEPANARLRPVVVSKCEIRGVVTGVVRRL